MLKQTESLISSGFQAKKKTYGSVNRRFMVDDTRLELVKACRSAPGLQPPVPLELRSSSN